MNDALLNVSNQLADAVDAASLSVVQVHGRRRPVSGVVHSAGVVVTSARALGREDGLQVRESSGVASDAELRGWDPVTGLAVLQVPTLAAVPATLSTAPVRLGQLAVAVARSWSNVPTASAGIISVIGGPLRTGGGGRIERVIRTTAPMHEGFAGGAFADVSGRLIGIATALFIRGFAVVIPADIAWAAAASIVEHGSPKRGYLGVAVQPVRLGTKQRGADDRSKGLVVVDVSAGSAADAAGLLVGDVLLDFDGEPLQSPEELLMRLQAPAIGRTSVVRALRGESTIELRVTIGEK